MNLNGLWVHFRIRDVYVPDPATLLAELYGADVLQGRVVAVSDTGEPGGLYAVIEIEGFERPLIVPEASLHTSHDVE